MNREIKRKYNTKPNKTSFKKGHKPFKGAFGKGSTQSEKAKELISKSLLGKRENEARNWKGNNAGYVAIHTWVKNKLGKPNRCENPNCKSIKPKRYEWASISRKTLRDKNDFVQLCPSCHRKYDIRKITLEQLYEQ